jgi:phosphotransferase system enzyme I (PtsI)
MADEIVHHGYGASGGIVYGPAYVIAPDTLRLPRHAVSHEDVDAEIARLEDSLAKASRDIERVQTALVAAEKSGEAEILESHLLILADEDLSGTVRERIRNEHLNAAYAFHSRVGEVIGRLEASDNAYLRERIRDIRDVEHRVIRNLLGEREPAVADLMQNAILVAHDLPASLTAELDRDRILGFATELGTATSHTAILARALEIPAVVGLGPILARLTHGAPIILDGREGLLIENPSDETLAECDRLRAKIERKRAMWVSLADRPGRTADGVEIKFLANIDFPREVEAARTFGCEGVGLYRTEYLFLQSGGEPSEDEQFEVYRRIVQRMEGRPVTIRTLDLGGDKLLEGIEPEDNPFLGWRAIRYCLDRPEVFRAQLRAILRAGADGPVAILLPMLTTLEEADEALEHVRAVRAELEAAGIPHAADCPVGVLVETPAAALQADALAQRFDFLSLGTNDLIQYTLAVDRGNRRIAHLFQPFHPAVLMLVARVVDAARRVGKEVTVCGEMGSNSRAAPILLGLGVRRFSMVPARIPRLKQVLGRIRLIEAEELAAEALELPGDPAIRELVAARFADRFHHEPDATGEEQAPQ